MDEPAGSEEWRSLLKIEPRQLIVPLVAVFVLVVTLQQTSSALRASGMWQPRPSRFRAPVEDPYTLIDHLLAQHSAVADPEAVRNPFAYGAAAPVAVTAHPSPRHHAAPAGPVTPPAPPQPILTSIVWAATPSATIRYEGKEFSVMENSLFAEFRVKTIARNEVVLDRNGESIVLTFRPKGDTP